MHFGESPLSEFDAEDVAATEGSLVPSRLSRPTARELSIGSFDGARPFVQPDESIKAFTVRSSTPPRENTVTTSSG